MACVQRRLRLFLRADLETLWKEALEEHPDSLNAGGGVQTRQRKRQRVAPDRPLSSEQLTRIRQQLAEGAAKKALQLLNSVGSHDPWDPHVWNRLKELHPGAKHPLPDDLPASQDPRLSDDDAEGFWEKKVSEAVLHFPRASAPGPSGLRPSHLQDALKRKGASMGLVAALSRLTKLWCAGHIPAEQAPFLCSANLTPLRKADGGVRPVAVGETLNLAQGPPLDRCGTGTDCPPQPSADGDRSTWCN